MKEKLKNLISVKSVVTLVLTAVFSYLAITGKISGTGLAIGKTQAPAFMLATISAVTTPGALTPINTSAPRMASASVPVMWFGLVL